MPEESKEDKKIFFSYRSSDRDFALKLTADLKNSGAHIWMDVLDGGLRPGDKWNFRLQEALDHSAGVIALLTPEYVQPGSYGRRELLRAVEAGKPIFPVLLRQLQPSEKPLEIQDRQYVDFTSWRDEARYHTQLEVLLAVLRAQSPGQVGETPELEEQYLTRLLADLEHRRGVMEYVELTAEAQDSRERPVPWAEDEFGFQLLVKELSLAKQRDKRRTEQQGVYLPNMAAALKRYPRFVLVGEPGSGKTTTLRHLARDAARQRLEHASAPLPLLLSLAEWSEELSPFDFVRGRWPFSSDPSTRLANGEILLLLDGLNEMGAAGISKANRLRTWLGTTAAPQRLILTCRLDDYSGDLSFDTLPTLIVLSMNDAEIAAFAGRYLGDATKDFLNQVLSQKDPAETVARPKAVEMRSLVHLARNPYLLSALIYIYQHSSAGRLPRNRGALFSALTQALWERERLRGISEWKPYTEARVPFASLAHAMIKNGLPISIPVEYAAQHVPRSLLKAAGATWIEIESEEVHFYHQLAQEYFAALHLLEIGWHDVLALPQFKNDAYSAGTCRIAQPWDEVLIALCGIAPKPEQVVQEIADIDPYLGASCLGSGVGVSDALRTKIIKDLESKLFTGKKTRAIEMILETWINLVLVSAVTLEFAHSFNWLREISLGLPTWVFLTITIMLFLFQHFFQHFHRRLQLSEKEKSAVHALAEIGDVGSIQVLLKAMRTGEWLLRLSAEEALVRRHLVEAVPELLQLLRHRRADVRASAVSALRKLRVPDAIDSLVIALKDTDGSVRAAAVRALADFRLNRSDIEQMLVRALTDSAISVRASASQVLGEINAVSAAPQLAQALKDRNYYVRGEAARALGVLGSRVAHTAVPVLLQALHDPNHSFRLRVIQALAQIKDPASVSGLRAILNDRRTATHRLIDRLKQLAMMLLDFVSIGYFRKKRVEVRLEAARALGEIGGTEAVEGLVEALEYGEKSPLGVSLCEVARRALEKIGSPEAKVALSR